MTTVQVEHIDDVRKKVTFEVPSEKLTDLMDARYRDLKKTVQLRGFRKGKVPLDMIRSFFKSEVEADATREIIEETFEPGLEENNITAVSVLKIEPLPIERDKPFTYVAEIEVPPPVEPKDYKGLKLTKTLREVTEAEVEERLAQLRQDCAVRSPLPDGEKVAEGDFLVIDVEAGLDGDKVAELSAEDYHLELGRDFFLEGFDAKIIGLDVGATEKVTLQLGDDFPVERLRSKEISFDVKIKEAKRTSLPDLDDDFAKDIGEFETLEELKDIIRKDLQELKENETKRELMEQVTDKLVEIHDVEVPESMINQRIEATLEQTKQRLRSYGIPTESLDNPSDEHRARLRESAVRGITATLVLRAIAEKEGLAVSEEELDESLSERASQLGESLEDLKEELAEHNILKDIRAELLDRKVMDFIIDHAEITEKEATASAEETDGEEEKE